MYVADAAVTPLRAYMYSYVCIVHAYIADINIPNICIFITNTQVCNRKPKARLFS